jgi:adenylate cyclase
VARVSFRLILLTVVLGLIVASTLSTTWLSASGFRAVIRSILEKQVEMTLDSVTGRVEDLFDPAGRLADSLTKSIQDGKLSTDDPARLATMLADMLSLETGIAWLSFGYADGRFAGAWTNKDALYANLSWPDAGRPMEWRITSDGTWLRTDRPNLPPAFDARRRPWFQLAEKFQGKAWTAPYKFASGEPGISVVEAVRKPNGSLLGVVTVDFFLTGVAEYLEKLRSKFPGDTLVFSIHGQLIATPRKLRQSEAVTHVRNLLREKDPENSLRAGKNSLITEVEVDGEIYIVGVQAAQIPGNLDCVSAIIFSRREAFGPMEETILRSIYAALGALGLSLLAGFLLAGRIAKPLGKITRQLVRIGSFDLAAEPAPSSPVREVNDLSHAVERMRASLASFSRYVPVELVRDLVCGGGIAETGGERRSVTIMFCDLAGFTSFAEKKDPESAVAALTSYFEQFGEAIDVHGGVIDKFLGDGIMALFNAPRRMEDAAACACRAALEGTRAVAAGETGLAVRVGIQSGEALVGNIGTSSRFSFTAIGDCVNLASRLESLNKAYGSAILAGTAVRKAAGESEFLWRTLDRAAVFGRDEPIEIHELLARRDEATPALIHQAETYEAAFAAYLDKNLDRAHELLTSIALEDHPARALLARIDAMREDANHPAWEGIFRHTRK